ncbi:MAG: phytanoyl-CoA dioxygenase family protein [Candidatus Binatia bacterium]
MLSYFGPQIGADEVATALNAEGAAIVENTISLDMVEQIRGELEQHMPRSYLGHDAFTGFKTRRLGGLTIKSPTFASLLTRPLMLSVCDRLLQPHCSLYQLAFTQAIEIGPGEPAQTPHRDDIVYSIPQPHPEFEVLFALALTEFTEENGATRIVLGSHRWGPERIAHPEESVPAVMPAGSVLFFLGSTWHGGGHNRSPNPRVGVFAKYSLGHLRQEENQFLIAPPDVARTLAPELRALIGYKVGTPYLGYVLEPELQDLFVDFAGSLEKSYAVTGEIEQRIQRDKERAQ